MSALRDRFAAPRADGPEPLEKPIASDGPAPTQGLFSGLPTWMPQPCGNEVDQFARKSSSIGTCFDSKAPLVRYIVGVEIFPFSPGSQYG